ncbi:hypothetical protein U1Q18_017712 [Sarracenia purpurea var. burkii]
MGSCISKCKRKRKRQEESNHVQDKLVISQASEPPPLPPHPHPPLSSAHSHSPILSSLSCTNASGSGSSSVFSSSSSLSSSSCSNSSTISPKERSFSNEFLWSCLKENPQVIRIDPIEQGDGNTHANKLEPPGKINAVPVKQPTPPRYGGGTPRKRARANSPAPAPLSRQRSFRREPEWLNSSLSVPSRTPIIMPPSPDRRLSGLSLATKENIRLSSPNNDLSRHRPEPEWLSSPLSVPIRTPIIRPPSLGRKLAGLSSATKENIWPSSPNNNLSRLRPCLVKRETLTRRIGSKIEEAVARELASGRDVGDIAAEDIDNPLIALDCFIFL